MALNTFDVGLVFDPATGRGVPAAVAQVTDPDTGVPVDTFELDGVTPKRVVTNSNGYFEQFTAVDVAHLRLRFGSVDLDVFSNLVTASGVARNAVDETITGAWDFTQTPTVDGVPIGTGSGAPVVSETQPVGPTFWLVAPDSQAPTVPASLTATATSATTIDLSWSASSDNVAVTGYEYRVGGGSAVDAGPGTTETVTGLTPSTLYSFEVRAYDAAGNLSGWSSPASATTDAPAGDTTPPTAGTLAGSGQTDTGFTLTVSGASDETALNAAPYRFSTDNGATYSAWQSGASYGATGLTASTSYTCVHQVRDAAGNISTGTPVTVSTTASAPATLVADTFDRADTAGGGLGVTSTGAVAWSDPGSMYRILSNQADPLGAGATNDLAIVETGQQAMSVSADLYGGGAELLAGVVARYDATNTHYHARMSGSAAGIQLYRFVNGTATQLATTVAHTWTSGDTLTLEVVEEGADTRVRVLVAGVEKINHLDTAATRPTGTKAGLRSNGNGNATFDNFAVTGV